MNREILLRARGRQIEYLLKPLFSSDWPRKTNGPFIELQRALAYEGYDLRTKNDLVGKPDAEIHVNVQPVGSTPSFLLRLESGFVVPENNNLAFLKRYQEVFTWDVDLASKHRFFHIHHPQDFLASEIFEPLGLRERERPFCMIASNKALRTPSENDLYRERQRVIAWFESHAPTDFDLYGRNWNLPMADGSLKGRLLRGLSKVGLGRSSVRVYRGAIAEKFPALLNTRFSFAFENVSGLPGYLTEKLFDCLCVGCIPIYCGDPLASSVLPDGCFIPFQPGESIALLYSRLMNMHPSEFSERQAVGRNFLSSKEASALSSRRFAEVVSSQVVAKLTKDGL